MKTILFLVSSVGSTGGIQRNLSMISDELSKKGYKVKILSVFEFETTPFSYNSDIELLSCKIKETSDLKKQFLKTYLQVNKVLKREYYDLLVIEGMGYVNFVSKSIFLRKTTIAVDHEGIQFQTSFGLSSFGRKKAVRNADFIRTLTKNSKNEYVMKYPHSQAQITEIPNPINNNIKANNFDLNSNKMLYVGRLSKEKGITILVESLIELKKRELFDSNWTLDIFGSGPLEAELKKMVAKEGLNSQIIFRGFSKSIHSIYSEYAFLILPSNFESFGLVLVEALKSGIPVLASDSLYGPKEIIQNNVNGLLIKKNSIEDLSEKIYLMIKNQNLRKKLASQAQLGLDKYELDDVVDKWVKLIESRDL